MMRSTHPTLFIRLLAVFVGFWLWMMPQVLNARYATLDADDLGTCPSPVNEEEETKHAPALPLLMTEHAKTDPFIAGPCSATDDQCPLCGTRGEVPHPPPWS